ncbi:unnamed protein product [Arctia plantaginis]|uniref:ZZ-type domain-containing protein n=1 Tax=Arctia plantaginis TaxID=874455 RepID=A0A8S0ZJ75_ARCPL|nr:unnamed protein product [Arctia plantaginis]
MTTLSKQSFCFGFAAVVIKNCAITEWLEQWLRAIGREDLLEKNLKKLSYRVCSRHFSPASIKNKHLCADAMPTLYLPGNKSEEPEEETRAVHNDIACNSCSKVILGYRYKCITCLDYDLCSKCEMFEAHPDHFMLRIPKPVNFKVADDLIKKWQRFVNVEHVTVDSRIPIDDGSSDDDLPITKYVKQNDSGIDLPEDMKTKIRNEVTRILAIKHIEPKKRKKDSRKKEECKKKKLTDKEDKSCGTEDLESLFPEVVFADVNDIGGGQILEVKHEMPTNITQSLEDTHEPMADLNFSDTDFMLTGLS